MIIITLPDGSNRVFDSYVSTLDVSKDISSKLTDFCLAGLSNGKLIHAFDLIKKNTNLYIITSKDEIGLNIISQTCVYILGFVIKKIFPNAKMADSFVIKKNFYYDIDISHLLKEEELNILEKLMRKYICNNYTVFRKYVTWEQAYSIFEKRKEYYKMSILNKFSKNRYFSLYYQNEYVDISLIPQTPNVKFCRYFTLNKNTSGVFWYEKDGKKKILQRISGIVLENKKEFNSHFNIKYKHIGNRDHRKIGKQIDLYHISKETPGMIYWHNNGLIIFKELENFIREKLKIFSYKEVKTPFLLNSVLWKKTGHWKYYSDNIYHISLDNKKYCIKPMNCPAHIQIFNQNLRSYKDLPFRIAEFGCCHRNEPSGSLYGLMRVRNFTQDDAHIFCKKNQVKNEVIHCINMILHVYAVFGFKNIIVKLSTRPDNRIGDDNVWDNMEKDLVTVLLENKINFVYQPEQGAFYGPKIEFSFLDCFNREWQCGTIQLDFLLPSRLEAFYINENNIKIVPVMIHRAIFGSIERFIAILTEEFSGCYPTWLSPIQVVVMNVSKHHLNYVLEIKRIFSFTDIRIEKDIRNKKINFKIREHTLRKVPYMLICGSEEIKNNTISIRTRCGKHVNNVDIYKFIKYLKNEIKNRHLNIGGLEILK
ncbi:MAG: threonine--tRNA ligase [Candidatus Westeberhardia cardiocondylae]|nr:threonine--tRNA ligase [Candidatus Westeberhardia cardiocondylae]